MQAKLVHKKEYSEMALMHINVINVYEMKFDSMNWNENRHSIDSDVTQATPEAGWENDATKQVNAAEQCRCIG